MKLGRVVLSLFLCCSTACAWWMAGRNPLGLLDGLIFDHGTHRDEGVECQTCHTHILEAASVAESPLPTESVCLECHEREGNCDSCHVDGDDHTRPTPKPDQRRHSHGAFSHVAHYVAAGQDCGLCHSENPSTGSGSGKMALPGMGACIECHGPSRAGEEPPCFNCHDVLDRAAPGSPQATTAETFHSGDWLSLHRSKARVMGRQCMECHTQTMCAECHSPQTPGVRVRLQPEAVERPMAHRGDWQTTHAMEARANGSTCLRCHDSEKSCNACHEASGVMDAATRGGTQHPPNYVYRGGSAFHGDEARLRIETCMSCHDAGAASNCVQCHAVGGIGGNPHPPGYAGRYSLSDAVQRPMCRTCHSAR